MCVCAHVCVFFFRHLQNQSKRAGQKPCTNVCKIWHVPCGAYTSMRHVVCVCVCLSPRFKLAAEWCPRKSQLHNRSLHADVCLHVQCVVCSMCRVCVSVVCVYLCIFRAIESRLMCVQKLSNFSSVCFLSLSRAKANREILHAAFRPSRASAAIGLQQQQQWLSYTN